jgi:hypothetical protein
VREVGEEGAGAGKLRETDARRGFARNARKIRARAIQRGGELLEQEKRQRGGDRKTENRTSDLKEAIRDAGLTPAEARTMINVARVPAEQFREVGRARQSGVA